MSPKTTYHPIALAVLLCCALQVQAQTQTQAAADAASANAPSSAGELPTVTVTAPIEGNELPGVAPGGLSAKGARLGTLGNVRILDAPVSVNA